MGTRTILQKKTNGKEYYEKLTDLTLQLWQNETAVQYTSESMDCWNQLYRIWQKYLQKSTGGVFKSPLEFILFGEMKKNENPVMVEFFYEIAEAILYCDEAMECWQTIYWFFDDMRKACSPRATPEMYRRYLVACLYVKIFHPNRRLHGEQRYYGEGILQNYAENLQYIEAYQICTQKLLSAAAQWSEEKWLDYSWLCAELKTAYGTDFQKDRDSVNVLYRGMLARQGWQNGVIYSQYEIFGVNLYPVFTPFLLDGDIDNKIYELAQACYDDEHSRKVYLKNPVNRWIYKTLQEWGKDPSREYSHDATVLAFTMGICG